MAGLQRSVTSFRRQGSSGLVWEDRLLSGDSNQIKQKEEEEEEEEEETVLTLIDKEKSESKDFKPLRIIGSMERSRSNGGVGRAFRTGKVSPAIEPPSPKLSACGLCSAFGKPPVDSRRRKPGKRRR